MSLFRPGTMISALILFLAAVQACLAQELPRPALGVTLASAGAERAVINGIYPGSPAQRVGMLIGDQIVSINGEPVRTTDDVVRLIGAASITKPVRVQLDRQGWENTVLVTLDDARRVMRGEPRRTNRTTSPSVSSQRPDAPQMYFNPVPTPGHWIGPQRQGAGWVGGFFSSGGGYGGRGG